MARDHARMMLTMWDDPDWLDLTVSQHQVYWVIEASHALSTAGVAPLVPARYCRGADQTPAKVMRDIKALAARRFLLVDESPEALRVMARRFAGVDGIAWMGFDPAAGEQASRG